MSVSKLEIRIPGGQTKSVDLQSALAGESLAKALEDAGVPLNMRCGGRGLCRGCKVEVPGIEGLDTFQACQRTMESLPANLSWVQIPENSWRDHSLHGVSVFEIHTKVELNPSRNSGHGIALDIGTTTLAGALWSFEDHHCLAHGSRLNPQARFGDNVVSRINYAMENGTGEGDLQRVLVKEGLIPMIWDLCRSAGVAMSSINCATASGNPTMLHTLLGEPLDGLAKYPFKPVFLESRTVDSKDIGFWNSFELNLLPGLGPFVGSDILGGALASGMLDGEGPVLLIDFGTNGEILLSCEKGFLATATAAGPAFEGGRLSCGSVARVGVISSISREGSLWDWTLTGNKEGEPQGISGAAYVDFLAAGAGCGLLDRFGRFDRTSSEVKERSSGENREWAINLSEKAYVTEADVAEILQAKAAIGGGVLTLMEEAGIKASDLKKVLVAGGFGYHLNPKHAIEIGLLPQVSLDRIQMTGNASLGGACLLLNDREHPQIQRLLRECKVVELNKIHSFEDNFTDCLMLEPMDA